MPDQQAQLQTNVLVIDRRARTRQLLSRVTRGLIIDASISVVPSVGMAKLKLALTSTQFVVIAEPTDVSNRQLQLREIAEVAPSAIVIPIGNTSENVEDMQRQLAQALKGLDRLPTSTTRKILRRPPEAGSPTSAVNQVLLPAVIVIAASTGGPDALAEILAVMPPSTPVPILVVQHMPAQFTDILAQRLDRSCAVSASEAVDGELLRPGHIYIAPGSRHMGVKRRDEGVFVELSDTPPVNFCRPSADVLFASAAETYAAGALALVMTGMGTDGSIGAGAVVSNGGYLIAQDPSTATVSSMPNAVVKYANEIIPLSDIGKRLAEITTRYG